MAYLSELFSFMVLIPSAVLCLIPMRNQLKLSPKRLALLLCLLFALLVPSCAALVVIAGIPTNYVLLPLMAVFFVCYHSVLKTHLSASSAVFLLVMALMSFPSNLSLAIDSQIHPLEALPVYCPLASGLQLAFSTLLLLLYAWFFFHFLSRLLDFLDSPRVWSVTLPVPMAFILLNILVRPQKYETMNINRVYDVYLYYLLLAFFLINSIYVIFYMMAVELQHRSQDRERLRLFEMQESQYVAQQRYITESSRQRHDFRQQLLSMAQLAQNGDFETLSHHLSECITSMPDSVTTYCTNTSVNALLNYCAAQMKQAHILSHWKISLPAGLQITDIELCSLLGNLLENAWHGCQTLPPDERYHDLTITARQFVCDIVIEK